MRLLLTTSARLVNESLHAWTCTRGAKLCASIGDAHSDTAPALYVSQAEQVLIKKG
jgi:hypothetical protein